MKQSNLRKLERYLFNHLSHNYKAAFFMADIVGVLIGVKPSCMRVISEKDLYKFDILRFCELLKSMNLSVIFERRFVDGEYNLEFYVANTPEDIAHLRLLFKQLQQWSRDNNDKAKPNIEIGKALGYPQSAIEYYAAFSASSPSEDSAKSHAQRMAKYYYYAHSEEHQNQEFAEYDRKINFAMDKFAPRSAKEMRKKYPNKRWLD